jgi:hypothetical protein
MQIWHYVFLFTHFYHKDHTPALAGGAREDHGEKLKKTLWTLCTQWWMLFDCIPSIIRFENLDCKDDRLILCDNDRVLKLSRDGSIRCPQGPAVLFFEDVSLACGEKWLNRQNQTFLQNVAIS